jgi:hypothetical protein
MKLIEDCLDWKRMDGSSELEKKLNSYLCFSLVARNNTPTDECLVHAQKIAMIANPTNWTEIRDMLWNKFKGPRESVESPEFERISSIAKCASAILAIERRGK